VNPQDTSFRFRQGRLQGVLKYKRYSKKKQNYGFYYGAYLRAYYQAFIEEDYYRTFEEYEGMPSSLPNHSLENLGVGIHLGYKFLLWEKLVLEPALGIDYDIVESMEYAGYSFGALLELKLGYRFPAK